VLVVERDTLGVPLGQSLVLAGLRSQKLAQPVTGSELSSVPDSLIPLLPPSRARYLHR
jgi:hypothetical protein